MKRNTISLALALTLVGTLAACSTDKDNTNGTNSNDSGSGTTTGQVSRRYQTGGAGQGYWEDGRYTAGPDGRVYTGRDTVSRDLTQGARDIVRDAGDAIGDIGRGVGEAARDITGNGSWSGTPSWEPSSSASYR